MKIYSVFSGSGAGGKYRDAVGWSQCQRAFSESDERDLAARLVQAVEDRDPDALEAAQRTQMLTFLPNEVVKAVKALKIPGGAAVKTAVASSAPVTAISGSQIPDGAALKLDGPVAEAAVAEVPAGEESDPDGLC